MIFALLGVILPVVPITFDAQIALAKVTFCDIFLSNEPSLLFYPTLFPDCPATTIYCYLALFDVDLSPPTTLVFDFYRISKTFDCVFTYAIFYAAYGGARVWLLLVCYCSFWLRIFDWETEKKEDAFEFLVVRRGDLRVCLFNAVCGLVGVRFRSGACVLMLCVVEEGVKDKEGPPPIIKGKS